MSYLLIIGVGLHDQAQIDLRLELLQCEVCERNAIPAVDVLVLVLDRSVNDEEAVEVHQDAAASRAFALTMVFRRRENGKHLRYRSSLIMIWICQQDGEHPQAEKESHEKCELFVKASRA